jgi:hypothetical protein
MELVAILLSFVALVISLIALYLTSLRPAEVEIDHVPRDDELPTGRFSGPRPADHDLFLGSCRTQERAAGFLRASESLLPLALEAGDAHSAFVCVKLHGHSLSPEQLAARFRAIRERLSPREGIVLTEEDATRIGAMEAIVVTVAWRFTRTAGLPVASRWLPRWLRSRRESVERSIRVEVDARHYRDWCIERWRTYEAWNHLADIAERAARGDQPTAWPGG